MNQPPSPAPPRRVPPVRVRWQGDQFQNHSLSIVNRQLCSVLLQDPSVELELDTREAADPAALAEVEEQHRQAAEPSSHGDVDVTVRHQWPPDWTRPSEGAWVAVQPWEYGAVPQEWLDGLAQVDEVWCYSSWVRDCYELSGVPAEKLHVVPLGVDASTFSPGGPRRPLPTSKTRKFLFCGGVIARKGIDVLVNAYRAEFTEDDDVCLVIKAHGTRTSYQGANRATDLVELAQTPGAEILVIDDDLSTEQLAELYRSCTALVHPYRGEGFALPVAEAMSCGLPVIVTDGGATADFCDSSNAWLVPGEIVELDDSSLGPSAHTYFWIEPDVQSLQHCLRLAANASPSQLQRLGEAGRARIVSGYTWTHAAREVRRRLLALEA